MKWNEESRGEGKGRKGEHREWKEKRTKKGSSDEKSRVTNKKRKIGSRKRKQEKK